MLPLEHSAILLTFIKLPFVFKIFVLSNFKWPLKTAFIVSHITYEAELNDASQNIDTHFNPLSKIGLHI